MVGHTSDQFSAEHGDWEQFVEKLLTKWLPFEFIEKLSLVFDIVYLSNLKNYLVAAVQV